MADLLEFSNTALPLSKIPDYIKEKTNEKIKVRDEALGDARITSLKLKWYTDLSKELRKYGIPVHDISKLVKLVDNIRQYDYNVEKITNEFADLERLRLERKSLQESILSTTGKEKLGQLQITQQLPLLLS